MKNLLLEVETDFENILKEEYGVSFEVEKLTNDVCGKIREMLKGIDREYDELNIPHKKGEFKLKCFGCDIRFVFDVVMFKDDKTFDDFVNFYTFDGDYNAKDRTITLNICMLNGQILNDTFGREIQHELTHVYDAKLNSNKEDKTLKSIYKTSVYIINNRSVSKDVRDLCTCMYLTFESEQIANANGFDNMLKVMRRINSNHVRETEEYKYLYLFKKVISNFDEYNGMCKQLFNKSDEWCYKRITKAYKDYARRLGRIFIKNKMNENITEICKCEKPLKTLYI